jgi:DUF1680 family protein
VTIPPSSRRLSRRDFARLSVGAAAAFAGGGASRVFAAAGHAPAIATRLTEVGYGDVQIDSALHEAQLTNTHDVLMNLDEDSLLKPFREMGGQAAPGADLGGWYSTDGFAPGVNFGQWISALARYHAISGSPEVRAKVLRLNDLYARSISERFYDQSHFPAYCYDKLVLGLIDSHRYVGDARAFAVLERTTAAALPHLPGRAVDREVPWRPGKDQSYRWDESYTNPENLFLAYQRGAGRRYRDLGIAYLDDASWFDPLAEGRNVLRDKHAYSYVNSLSSAMQAYITLGSQKHLRAARNAFDMLEQQSFATGGWGPDEMLEAPGSGKLYASLAKTHHSFETPCGSYAHFKLARYLLRVTGDPRYGDSMERVMYNTVLGAKPMQADGRAFYYADYHSGGSKVFYDNRFPCCSGTLPQVAADYRINTYLRDARGVYVNLYIPSTLRFVHGGAKIALTQRGDYPFADGVSVEVGASQPTDFTVNLRIPAWAEGARLHVNGVRWRESPVPGRFAAVSRRWRSGDRIELELPRTRRLQPIDAQHPDVAALMCGPLTLFAILPSSGETPRLTRPQLLAATQTAPRAWTVASDDAPVTLLPYVEIEDQRYSTYLAVSA